MVDASYQKPGTQVIIHAQAPTNVEDAMSQVRGFTEMGWQVQADTESGTPLGEALKAG